MAHENFHTKTCMREREREPTADDTLKCGFDICLKTSAVWVSDNLCQRVDKGADASQPGRCDHALWGGLHLQRQVASQRVSGLFVAAWVRMVDVWLVVCLHPAEYLGLQGKRDWRTEDVHHVCYTCLFSALSRRVGAVQISIIIIPHRAPSPTFWSYTPTSFWTWPPCGTAWTGGLIVHWLIWTVMWHSERRGLPCFDCWWYLSQQDISELAVLLILKVFGILHQSFPWLLCFSCWVRYDSHSWNLGFLHGIVCGTLIGWSCSGWPPGHPRPLCCWPYVKALKQCS